MTELLFTLAVMGGMAAIVLGAGWERSRERARLWRQAAERCGLGGLRETTGLAAIRGRKLTAVTPVFARFVERGDVTRIGIQAPGGLSLRPETFASRLRKAVGRGDVETGDAEFDARFLVEGPPALAYAALDRRSRSLLCALHENVSFELAGGELRVDVPAARLDKDLTAVLGLLVQLARRLGRHSNAARRLAANVACDPVSHVRRNNLLVLIREYRDRPATGKALRKALADVDPEVRLHAAMAIGSKGQKILLALAEGSAPDGVTARALTALGTSLPPDRVRALLDRARGDRRRLSARACIDILGRHGGGAALEALGQVLAEESDELAAAAADAVGAMATPAAEAALTRALVRESAEVRVAAARALGRVGSIAAVWPLTEAGQSPAADGALRRVVRQSVAEIQSRAAGGASPGQVSLTSAPAGRLSLDVSGAGALSTCEDESGRVSEHGPQVPVGSNGSETQPPGRRVRGAD